MGRFAKVMGLGVKGRLELELQKNEYFPGELVLGRVRFVVHELVDCGELVLTAVGREVLSWKEGSGDHEHHHKCRQSVLQQEIRLNPTPQTYLPGEYFFPFEYCLPPTVPASVEFPRRTVGAMHQVRVRCHYKFTATTKVKGMLSADLGTERAFGVRPMIIQRPPQPVSDATAQQVRYLCCFNQGQCRVTAAADKNVLDVLLGDVAVTATIENASKLAIPEVRLRLYEDFKIHIPPGHTHGGRERSDARMVLNVKHEGLGPGASRSYDMRLPVGQLFPPGTVGTPAQIRPTSDGVFYSLHYHIAVEACFDWTPDVCLELPVALQVPILWTAPAVGAPQILPPGSNLGEPPAPLPGAMVGPS